MESFPRSPELSRDSDTDKPEKDSKKEKKIGGKVAETLIRPPEVHEESLEPKNAESIWQRIAALAEKREIDKSILKPVESSDTDSKLEAKRPPEKDGEAAVTDHVQELPPAAEKESPAHQATEVEDSAENEPSLESLSREEEQETVRRYAENRRLELQEELRELPDGAPLPVESAADLAFLKYVEDQFTEDAGKPVDEALDEAAEKVAEQLDTTEAGVEAVAGTADETESAEAPDDQGAEGEIPLDGSQPDEEETPIILSSNPAPPAGGAPTAGGGGNRGNGNVPPAPPGPPSGTNPPSGANPSGGRPYGPMPVYGSWASPNPGYNPAAASSYPTASAAPNIPRRPDLTTERRRAMAQGLLVGLLVGYLVGRRRGRIKTEKRLAPIQKKLEKQVKSLTEKVAYKEKAIRQQAREAAEKLREAERRRLAERLAVPAAAGATAAVLAEKSNAKPGVKESMRPVESMVQNRHASELHAGRQQLPPERLGRFLVEAPAAAAVSEASREHDDGPEKLAIDFGKKVEEYSTPELNRATEKIRIEGVSLKEIRNAHNLDEKAVRRIVRTFIEGGNVPETLNRELLAKDAKFERDPHLKQTDFNAASSGGGAASRAAAAAVIGLSRQSNDSDQASGRRRSEASAATTQRPGPWSGAAEYRKHAAEVVVGIVVLMLIAAVIITILR